MKNCILWIALWGVSCLFTACISWEEPPDYFEVSILNDPDDPRPFFSSRKDFSWLGPAFANLPQNDESDTFSERLTPEQMSFVRRWAFVGPFAAGNGVFDDEANLTPSRNAPPETLWRVEVFQNEREPGICDFSSFFREYQTPSIFYFCSVLDSRSSLETILKCGGNGMLAVWLNGTLIASGTGDLKDVKARFRNGDNRLVVKYVDLTDKMPRIFYLRLIKSTGVPFRVDP